MTVDEKLRWAMDVIDRMCRTPGVVRLIEMELCEEIDALGREEVDDVD